MEQAAEIVGGLDILEERTTADDERLELAAKVIQAASETTMPEKIRALAQVLAMGVSLGGDVDEAAILALALRDLEGTHVRVLRAMAEPRRGASNGHPWALPAGHLTFREIHNLVGRMNVFGAVFAVLVRHDLVTDRPESTLKAGGAQSWRVSRVGYLCLKLLGYDPAPDLTDPWQPPAD